MQKSTQTADGGVTLIPANSRGFADHGWLQARHSFSFADYFDPQRMGFGLLRVLNQDHVRGGGGFSTHGHQDMEIITWVQEGALVHQDSMGNRDTLSGGEIQVMSAGTGVRHSEINASATEGLDLLQMWILPAQRGTSPRWEQRASAPAERRGRFVQLVGPHAEAREGLLTIGQDARLFATLLEPGETAPLTVPAGRRAYVHVARGALSMVGASAETFELGAGDGAAIEPSATDRELHFRGQPAEYPTDAVVWLLP